MTQPKMTPVVSHLPTAQVRGSAANRTTGVTFWEGVKISWQREIALGDPWRILQLAVGTVFYGAIHVFYVPVLRQIRMWKQLGQLARESKQANRK